MDGRRDTERISDVVHTWAADIICFQEVHQRLPWSGWLNQPKLLARALGMTVVFQRNLGIVVGGYGLAIASRFALNDVQRCFLPSMGERRGALSVTAQMPQGSVRVWCTHWGLNGEERLQQAAQLALWVNAGTGPVIVCGDCNEGGDGRAIRLLREDTGLRDAGVTEDEPTYPADMPKARIDFVLHSSDMRLEACLVPETLASDHRPVICDFG